MFNKLAVFGMLWLHGGFAHGKQWDVPTYLNKSLDLDENIKTAKIQRQISQANYESATDTFQNSLEVRPNIYRRELSLPNSTTGTLSDSRTGMTFDMKQILPTGSLLGLQGTRFFEKANPKFNGLNSDYKIYFEQALWKNAFGSMYRERRESASFRIQQMATAETRALIESCLSSLELYLNAYLSQEEIKIYQQVYNDGEKANSLAESGYQQKLLRKVDYLNAQSDFFRVKTELVKAKAMYQQRMSLFKTKIIEEISDDDTLSEPQGYFSQIQPPKVLKIEDVVAYQSAKAKIEAESAAYKAKRSESRSDISLGVASGKTTSVSQATATTFGEAVQDTLEVYLRFRLPIINKTLSADVSNAHYNMQVAEIEKSLLERQIRQQFAQLNIDEKNFNEQIEISQKNQKIKNLQLNEARKLLQVGRIQFEEYVRYRDSYFTEKTNELRLKSSLWQTKAKLAQFDDRIVHYCQGS